MSEIISFVCARFDLRYAYKTSWGHQRSDGRGIIVGIEIDILNFARRFDANVIVKGTNEDYVDFKKLSALKMLDLGAGSVRYYHSHGSRTYEPWFIRALRPFMDAWGVDRNPSNEDGMVRGDFCDENFLRGFEDGSIDAVFTKNTFDWNPCPRLLDLDEARENAGKEIMRVTHPGSVLYFVDFFRRKSSDAIEQTA